MYCIVGLNREPIYEFYRLRAVANESSSYKQIFHTPGRIQKVDPPQGSIIYTIGVLEPRIGGSTFLDPPRGLA